MATKSLIAELRKKSTHSWIPSVSLRHDIQCTPLCGVSNGFDDAVELEHS